jgi:hypothetical protein
MLPLLDRSARAADPAKADLISAAIAAPSADKVDTKAVSAAVSAIDSLYPCP